MAPPRNRQARKGIRPWMMPPRRPAAPVLHPLNNCRVSWLISQNRRAVFNNRESPTLRCQAYVRLFGMRFQFVVFDVIATRCPAFRCWAPLE